MIDNGRKTVEIRLYDDKRRRVKVGDSILFTEIGTENTVEVLVTFVKVYKTFEELFADFPSSSLGYDECKPCLYTDMYEYYTKKDEAFYGVAAIGIRKVY